MPNVGPMEILLLGLLAVLIFGPAKLPEIGRSIGRATREFRDSVSGMGEIKETIGSVNDVRTAMTPTNLAKAAMPASVKQVASDMTEMKDTITDPLGMKKEQEQDGAGDQDKPAAAKPEPAAD